MTRDSEGKGTSVNVPSRDYTLKRLLPDRFT